MKRWPLYLLAPTVLAIFLAVLPLALGETTLFHSDVLDLHLGIKSAAARTYAAGEMAPLVDMVRTTGEPMLGNANGLPLYPTNLLYLVAPFEWAFNAHYWLHWLLAPFAFYWLARAFGLGPGGASAAGVFWATGGFLVSQLNFYNLIALIALAPALAACWLTAAERPKYWPLAAVLLALLLLAGDPFSAALALAMAGLALFFRPGGWRPFPWLGVLLSTLAGLAIAAPGIVEMLRILPSSLRAVSNRDLETSLDQSLEWAALPDFVLPFFLGNFDMTFWGKRFFDGGVAFYPCLFPGLLALAAAFAAGRGGAFARPVRWAWLLLGLFVFLALGEHNPAVVFFYRYLPGFSALRFPIKFVLPILAAICLLGGVGFERFLAEEGAGRRRLARALAALSAFYLAAFGALILLPGPLGSWLRRLEPELFAAGPAFDQERARWAATLLVLGAAGLLLLGCCLLARRFPALSAALLLALGSVLQLELLEQLHRGADVSLVADEPPALAAVPADSLIFHRSRNSLRLLSETLPPDLIAPGIDLIQAECSAAELAPGIGVAHGRRYALAQTADYLDSFLGFFVSWHLEQSPDERMVPVLATLGVDRLLTIREIAPAAAAEVELLGRFPSPCRRDLFVYRLKRAAPGRYLMPGNVRRVANLEQGFALISGATGSSLDPTATVVLSGRGDVAGRPPGTFEVISEQSDSFELEVDSPAGAVLVARRTYLPIYRATVDGQPARLEVANLMHLGLELPPGRHRVRVEADRRPTRAAFALSLATLLALAFAYFRLARRGQPL